MSAPVYDRFGVAVYQGDCLDVMRQMPAESVHAVVTDPPYELTDGRKQDCASDVLRNTIIRDAAYDQAASRERSIAFRIESTLLSPLVNDRIHLDDDASSGEEEVDHDRLMVQVDQVLMYSGDVVLDEQGQRSEFRLWVREGTTRCVGACRCFAESGEGRLAIPVGLRYDPLGDTEGATGVVTVPRAELATVLTLDVARATAELRTACGADAIDPRFLLLPAQTVGACATARRLAAELQAGQVGSVDLGANGTGPIYLLAHRALLRFARPRLSQKGFMNRSWDGSGIAFDPRVWRQCLRVLKPGGHLLAFGGTRTAHRLACAVEDAGFEIRDEIDSIGSRVSWVYGQGMPKSLDVSKAIDRRPGVSRHAQFGATLKAARLAKGYSNSFDVAEVVTGRRTGAVANWEKYQFPEARWWPALRDLLDLDPAWDVVIAEADREVIGTRTTGIGTGRGAVPYIADSDNRDLTAPATDAARQWEGWGTGLRPSHEPIIVARRPLSSTVAGTVLEHGTGAINIGATRVGMRDARKLNRLKSIGYGGSEPQGMVDDGGTGRWPPNTIFSHVPALDPVSGEVVGDACAGGCVAGCAIRELDAQSGHQRDGVAVNRNRESGTRSSWYGTRNSRTGTDIGYGGEGGASRYFPCFRFEAKAPTHERPRVDGVAHPTCKPLSLVRWMTRLVCPPGGTVLDCFAGTGTTGQAARAEGFDAILIEDDPASIPLIIVRLDARPRTDVPVTPERAAEPDLDLLDLLDQDDASS